MQADTFIFCQRHFPACSLARSKWSEAHLASRRYPASSHWKALCLPAHLHPSASISGEIINKCQRASSSGNHTYWRHNRSSAMSDGWRGALTHEHFPLSIIFMMWRWLLFHQTYNFLSHLYMVGWFQFFLTYSLTLCFWGFQGFWILKPVKYWSVLWLVNPSLDHWKGNMFAHMTEWIINLLCSFFFT